MQVKAAGHRVLVKVKTTEERTESGLYIVNQTRDAEKRGAEVGTLMDVGPTAWKEFGDTPWASVGDQVLFAKYAGKWVPEHEDLLLLNDDDIVGVLVNE